MHQELSSANSGFVELSFYYYFWFWFIFLWYFLLSWLLMNVESIPWNFYVNWIPSGNGLIILLLILFASFPIDDLPILSPSRMSQHSASSNSSYLATSKTERSCAEAPHMLSRSIWLISSDTYLHRSSASLHLFYLDSEKH